MKNLLSTIIILTVTIAHAQSQADGKITGMVMDVATTQPVEYATVALRDPLTNKPVNGALCDDKGKFTITQVANGNYKLAVSFIGYETTFIDVTITPPIITPSPIILVVMKKKPTAARTAATIKPRYSAFMILPPS